MIFVDQRDQTSSSHHKSLKKIHKNSPKEQKDINEVEGELAKMFDNCREPPLRVRNDFRMCRVVLEIPSVYFRDNIYIDLRS